MSRHHHHHHQNMSRHHRQNKSRYRYDVIDDRPMLSSVEADTMDAEANNDLDFDLNKYDEDVNRFLDKASEELFKEEELGRSSTRKFEPPEDPPESHDAKPNYGYQDMCKIKIRETKEIMEDLSKLACYTCPLIGEHFKRMEQDHGTTFCKMDYNVRHPPFNRPWTNTWKFECTSKCSEPSHTETTHTAYCRSVVLTHMDSKISEIDYPEYVKDAVKLFEDFALETNRNGSMKDTKESSDTPYSESMWSGIKVYLRSNCRNELMMMVRAKKIPPHLLYKLRRFFDRAPEADTNVVSVFSIEQGGFPKKSGEHVAGLYSLKDVVGRISIEYKPKISPDFNAVEVIQLAKIIKEYAGLTQETTLLDIGCNFGVLSLMLSSECESVIGINTTHSLNGDIRQAEELKKCNKIHNATFIACNADELVTKCSPFIKQCITVAVLHLSPHYGKNKNVMIALRNLPSIWRVIVYGSFIKEHQKSINTLITEDHTIGLGERYLPMQGCILDKSSSEEKAFNIITLFERQSLITPKIELFEAGPTLNIKTDLEVYEYGSVDVKPEREEGYQESRSSRDEFEEERPFRSTDARRSDYSRDKERYRREKDRSSHLSRSREHRTKHSRRSRDDRRSSEERPYPASRHRSSFKDRQMLRNERFDSPPPRNHESHSRQSRDRHQRVSPISPLSIPNGYSPPSTSRSGSSSTSARDKSPVEKIPQLPVPHSLLSVKKEFQFTCPSPPRERNPSPPLFPPAEESDFLEEDFVRYPLSRTMETEPIESRENIVSSAVDDGVFKVPVKPEPTYPESPQKCVLVNVKQEPEHMDISPNHLDFQSMETPIHNPRDLVHPPPPAPATNFTVGEFGFPLRAHLSFLPRAKHDEIHMDDLPDVSRIKKEKDDGEETLMAGEAIDKAPGIKKEKDAGDETLTSGETVDKAPEIKKEKGVEGETLTTGEIADKAPQIKKEKYIEDETLMTEEPVDQMPEIKKEKGIENETLTTGEIADKAPQIKKEKYIEDETLMTEEPVDQMPEIKKEKGIENETLTTGEMADKVPEIRKEKDTVDETLMIRETMDGTSEIYKEKDASDETLTTGETVDEVNVRVKIKTEVVDPSYFAGSTDFNCEDIPLPMIIKSEPLESHEIPPVKVKTEPIDMEISLNPHNIESMQTPMHNPRILNDNSPASPPVKINDLETFSVKPNLSFLDMKREPEPSVNVKTEPDDEIAIIGEKRSKPKKSQPKIRVKNVDEIIKVKTELIEEEDLQTLIEERQKILRKLHGEEEDTDLPRAYKRQSRSPSRKHKRSPNSSPRRYSRSPSPYYKRKRSRKSPPERRRRRSPSSPIRFKKEPLSPTSDRRRERKRRSPSLDMREVYGTTNSRDKRSRRSRSRSQRRR